MLSFSKLTGPDVCSENHGHLSYPPNGDFGDFCSEPGMFIAANATPLPFIAAFITNDHFSI